MKVGMRLLLCASVAALMGAADSSSAPANAQDCKNRGQLDTLYCDDNNDLVAVVPTDPR
jgi:phosphonate transport system substrate-binding protein